MSCLRESSYFENKKIYGESNVQCKVGGQEEYRGADGQVGIEGSSRSAGKGKWCEVVWSCRDKLRKIF